jgi:hypothetical protein
LEHRYTDVATRHPVTTARDGAAVVGHGETEVFVRPSPATAAEQLADTFLTAQFGLALLIASVLSVGDIAVQPSRDEGVSGKLGWQTDVQVALASGSTEISRANRSPPSAG